LTLSDHQKRHRNKKTLAKLATQGDHKFATGRRLKFRLPPLFSSRLSRHTRYYVLGGRISSPSTSSGLIGSFPVTTAAQYALT
jgi:hypothetical protein